MNDSFVRTEYIQPIGVTNEANTISINYSNALSLFSHSLITNQQI